MAIQNDCPLAFVGLLVQANDDWSLNIEKGVLVVQHDKIVDRGQVNTLVYQLTLGFHLPKVYSIASSALFA